MGSYDLDRMGSEQFQDLVESLATEVLGSSARSIRAARDGYLDVTFDGPMPVLSEVPSIWEGRGAVQVKYWNRRPDATSNWMRLAAEVRDLLRAWRNEIVHGRKTPKYLILATNVTLIDGRDRGGREMFERVMQSVKPDLELHGWIVWDRTVISSMLDDSPSTRQRYLEQIVEGDFLTQLETFLPDTIVSAAAGAAQQVVSDLVARQWVRTGDSGYHDGSKVRLADIAIDLPCADRDFPHLHGRRGAASVTLDLGDQILNRKGGPGPFGLVLVGGPGQGKSTLAQVIAHAYRVAFLQDTDVQRYGEVAEQAFRGLRDRLPSAGIATPRRRRWPVVVELAKAGAAAARDDDAFSLLKYIADSMLIEGRPLDPSALLGWMSSWPSCLVLDGLDEVPDARARTKLIAAISGFVSELSAHRADVLVVATTRPQGYRGEFGDAMPCQQLELLEFTEHEALKYSEALTSVRKDHDPDLAAQVTDRLISAVHTRVTQRLMTTPLQVTIMTALAEEAVELPSDRFELFDRYYKVVYDREVTKTDAFVELRTLRKHIDYLHEQAALKLQARTEEPSSSDAVLTKTEIARMLRRRLTAAGYDETDSESTATKLIRLSTERLVMLVSRRAAKYEFEVRSLQEYMAARALTAGDDDAVLAALRELLPSTHWRNTWLLAAGRLFKTREHLSEQLVQLVTTYDTSSVETRVTNFGGSLASELYIDNLGTEFPTIRQALLRSGMTQFGDTSARAPRAATELIELALAHSDREQGIALDALHELGRENLSNLATMYLDERREGMSALAKQARTTLTEGRKYLKPRDQIHSGPMAALARSIERLAPTVPEALVLVERLDEGPASTAAQGAALPLGLLHALGAQPAREALASTVLAIRKTQPRAAAYGADLLRQYASRSLHRQTYTR